MKLQSVAALRRRLTLEAPTRGVAEAAAAQIAWTAVGSMWAAIMSRADREIVIADGQAARVTHEIELRWRGDVTADMRLRDGSRIFAVHAVRDRDPQRRRLVCDVEELAP